MANSVKIELNVGQIVKEITLATDEVCKELASQVAKEAKTSAAFRDRDETARPASKGLRRRIRVNKSRFGTGYLVKTAPHAHLIEFGHRAPDGSMVAARPFLRPALDKVMTEENIAEAGRKTFKKNGF